MKSLKAIVFATLMFGSLAANAGQPSINISFGGEFSPGIYGQFGFNNFLPLPILYAQPRLAIRHVNHVVQPVYRTHFDKKRKHAKHRHEKRQHAKHRHAKHRHESRVRHEKHRDEWRGDEYRRGRGYRG